MNEEDEGEIGYVEGKRRALLGVLRHVLGELGVKDPEAGKVRWVIERQETVAQLRAVCADHGDNDWDEDLHLGDVIEKHLADPLREAVEADEIPDLVAN